MGRLLHIFLKKEFYQTRTIKPQYIKLPLSFTFVLIMLMVLQKLLDKQTEKVVLTVEYLKLYDVLDFRNARPHFKTLWLTS